MKYTILFFCFFGLLLCQDSNYNINIYSYQNNSQYWWSTKNNFGKSPTKLGIDLNYSAKNLNTNYYISLSNSFSSIDSIIMGETYLNHHFSKNLNLKMGKYYRDFSLYMNDKLSSGSMLISNNAEAMPKIGLIGKHDFKNKNTFSLNWGIAHGFFKENKYYQDAPFLHEKFVYLNYKSSSNELSIGLVHEAIWAGTTTDLGSFNNPGNQPDSFKDFLKVFIAADGPLIEGERHANALGSHQGIWDFSYTIIDAEKKSKIYYQHYFEDTSSLRFANKIDGLWGIEFSNYLPNTNLLVEYLDTSNCCIDPPYQNDNYYWNYQYRDGWKYKDMIIGNPFVKAREETRLIHIGLSSKFKLNDLMLKITKKVNSSDQLRYQFLINRKINQNNLFVVLNGEDSDASLGIGLSFNIK